ncbi:hypothetical protein JCM31826_14250 [Thermaurantimonas aggregans]|uniref:isochorismate synthase n=1 Tax=Thermaurantimonas aggregans TaxID=2173829 RepID=A0A401XLR1_9FLAO|nr:isochorismate synthase [Thermaurantimonas aggregans]MCX8147807.1 isochorismate synthase [Thermaurantimonas aggregans]GCD77943.1 hypothetical protein JCM31826_14250 [Thermaurantimonas aggregans]
MHSFLLYRKPGYQHSEMVLLSAVDAQTVPTPDQPLFVFAGFEADVRLHLFRMTNARGETDIKDVDAVLKKNLTLAPEISADSKKHYLNAVESAIKNFDTTVFTKVVLSRRATYPAKGISYLSTFAELSRRYPDTMVFLMYSPETGCWMGATPERLLYGDNKEIHSMSLAGTRLTIDPTPWADKELEEQKIVTAYIEEVFSSTYHTISIKKNGPYEVTAGPVKHLRTDISGTLPVMPHWLQLALQLHPTPAVLGSHHTKAKEFIKKYEGYDRSYYTGFFGFWNFDSADFYVNLRSMQVFDDQVILYAGAGITAGSDAESEWRETELKMQTLLSVLV